MDELHLMTDNRQLWKGCQAGGLAPVLKPPKMWKSFSIPNFSAKKKQHTHYLGSIQYIKFQNLQKCEKVSYNKLINKKQYTQYLESIKYKIFEVKFWAKRFWPNIFALPFLLNWTILRLSICLWCIVMLGTAVRAYKSKQYLFN